MIDEKLLLQSRPEALNDKMDMELQNQKGGYNNGWNDCLFYFIDIIKKQPKVCEWIPVSERIPEPPSDNSMGEMKRFKEDLNLLCGLVNEHFEENQETNLERYYDDLIKEDSSDFGVVNGKIESCAYILCKKCEFEGGNCHKNRITWLTSKCKKRKYKFTQFEYDLINTYSHVDDRCKFNGCYQLKSLKEKGYFKNVDKNELIKDIIDNCEVV